MSKNQVNAMKVALKGEYRLVLNEGTDREKDTGWFPNLITDGGLDRLAINNPDIFHYSSIGTGTTAPANADTTLQAYVAQSSTRTLDSSSNDGASTYIAQTQSHWVYTQGAVVGNMAEVGVGWGALGTTLFSRARILDAGGSPTTLTVVALDQLTVYYKLTCTPQLTDITGTVSISGTSYNYTGRISGCASFFSSIGTIFGNASGSRFGLPSGSGGFGMNTRSTQTLGAITSTPSGTSTNAAAGSGTVAAYVAGDKHLDGTFSVSPSEGNSVGGIGTVVLFFTGSQQAYQYSFAATSGGTTIPKDNTKTFSLTTRFAWDRL